VGTVVSARKHLVVARAFDRRGRLLSRAANSYTKTHPLQAHFASLVGKPKAVYLHAEIAALIKARGSVYRLEVERYNANGDPVSSKPCPICQKAIEVWNVKRVIHT